MIHHIKYPRLFGLNSPIESIHRNISLKINIDLTIFDIGQRMRLSVVYARLQEGRDE